MKLFFALLILSVSFSSFSKSCFDRKYKKKYEKCLKANLFGNQAKCRKKKDKWQKKCDREESTQQAQAAQRAKYKSVEDQINAGRIANQSLEVWKDGKPLGWTAQGNISPTNKGYQGSKGAIISGKGSLTQTRRIPSRKWHGLYLRSNFNKNIGNSNQGIEMKVTIKKNGTTQRYYQNALRFPYPRVWEMSSIALKPELYESEITVAVNWNLPKGTTASLDEIRLLDINKFEQNQKDYRNYLKKEAIK